MSEQMTAVPQLVPIKKLSKLVPGTSNNFWYQRSRLDLIPGQQRCGRFVVVDLNVFSPALKAGEISVLEQQEVAA